MAEYGFVFTVKRNRGDGAAEVKTWTFKARDKGKMREILRGFLDGADGKDEDGFDSDFWERQMTSTQGEE